MTNDLIVKPRRSFIFSPGLRPEMFPKALGSGADIVCVELEDGIAPKDKDEARRNAMALFAAPQADDGVERSDELVDARGDAEWGDGHRAALGFAGALRARRRAQTY